MLAVHQTLHTTTNFTFSHKNAHLMAEPSSMAIVNGAGDHQCATSSTTTTVATVNGAGFSAVSQQRQQSSSAAQQQQQSQTQVQVQSDGSGGTVTKTTTTTTSSGSVKMTRERKSVREEHVTGVVVSSSDGSTNAVTNENLVPNCIAGVKSLQNVEHQHRMVCTGHFRA